MKTWLLAETISKELGADMMEIKKAKENGHSFLFKYIWGESQVVMGGKPPIMEPDRDRKEYDLIVLGFPV